MPQKEFFLLLKKLQKVDYNKRPYASKNAIREEILRDFSTGYREVVPVAGRKSFREYAQKEN